MSDQRITVEMMLQALLGSLEELAAASRAEALAKNGDEIKQAEARGRFVVQTTTAERIKKVFAEMPDRSTNLETVAAARAEAGFYKSQLLELGKLVNSIATGKPDPSDMPNVLKVLTPYMVLAAENRPKQ